MDCGVLEIRRTMTSEIVKSLSMYNDVSQSVIVEHEMCMTSELAS